MESNRHARRGCGHDNEQLDTLWLEPQILVIAIPGRSRSHTNPCLGNGVPKPRHVRRTTDKAREDNINRVCGYEETTTGHPYDNVVGDYEDHCRAGHPCPLVTADVES